MLHCLSMHKKNASCRAGSRFWLKLTVDKTLSLSWCAAVIAQINLSLKVALPARVNKAKREFANKDLVGGKWMV